MCLANLEPVADMHLLTLSGPLNGRRADSARQLFRDLAQKGMRRMIVNLEDVPFIDGRGLAALISGYKVFGSDATNFWLIGVREQPRLVFELTGYDRVFQANPGGFAGATSATKSIRALLNAARVAVPDLAA